jgi:hypothetical protein
MHHHRNSNGTRPKNLLLGALFGELLLSFKVCVEKLLSENYRIFQVVEI